MSSCPKCGSSELSSEDSSTVCTHCGYVLAENNITSDVTFAEGGDGSSNVVGQFVSDTRRNGGGQRQHRDVTIANGRRRIMHLASALKLTSTHVDEALRFFLLAVQHNFTQGRRTHNVIGACLYLVCRRHKTPHMLIDFSDALQANMFILGNTFFKLCAIMKFTPPLIDPSLYLHRFAASLQLGEHEMDIANTALRIVQRMKRDWIQIGRRPAGICGAALFIASRIHRVPINMNLILRTVKICDVTLRRRISEFKNLPSAQVPFSDFITENPLYTGDVDDDLTDGTSCDPPIFQYHRKQEAMADLKRQLEASGLGARSQPIAVDDADSTSGGSDKEDSTPNSPKTTKNANPKKRPSSSTNGEPTAKRPAETPSTTDKTAENSEISSSMDIIPNGNEFRAPVPLTRPNGSNATPNKAQAKRGSKMDAKLEEAAMLEMNDGLSDLLSEETFGDKECAFGEEIEDDMTNALTEAQEKALSGLTPAAANAPPLAIPAADGSSTTISTVALAGADDNALEFDASDIPDEAVEEYLNTPAEAEIKEIIWTELHKEYLEEQAEKLRLEEQMRAEGKEIPKKRSRPRKVKTGSSDGNAGAPLGDEILMEPIKEKSKKLNYEALDRAKQMRLASSRSTRAWLEDNFNEDGTVDPMDDFKQPFGAMGLQKPPPSAYLGSLKPTIPDPSSQHTTQTTQKYDDDDDDDDDADEVEEDHRTSEFNQHFRSNYEEEYDDY